MTGGRSARSPAAGYLPAPMRALQVQHRPQRHNAVGVDGGMTAVVMLLDVVEIHHVSNTLPLVQLAGVGPEVNVVRQPLQVALEVAVVDGIEADQGGEEAPVRFSVMRSPTR